MPLFGSKKDKKLDLPEVVDFSNDTWSYKGNPPDYQIQSDGFTYDVQDADGNDKNAISLGLSGMLVIILNAKSPKIKEDEILPPFGKVIKTRNWHSMTVKEANFLVQTAIKKLTNSATSGDVFDLASYAPLEVKRVLLKTLFTISRMQLPPEFREEAEHRIIDDIVPDIFAHPDYELALLTGLIVKPDDNAPKETSAKIETSPVLDPVSQYGSTESQPEEVRAETTPISVSSEPAEEPDSAFAELQKIYGRKIDTMPRREPVSGGAPQMNSGAVSFNAQNETASENSQARNETSAEKPVFSVPQPANPFAGSQFNNNIPQQTPNFGSPQPANPFENQDRPNIPQPNNPFEAANRAYPAQPQYNVPQPPVPNAGMMPPANPFAQNPIPSQNPGYPQMNPNQPNFQQPYPPQMWQQPNMQMPQNWNTQNSPAPQFPPQGWVQNQQQYMPNNQNPQMNQQWPNPNMPQNVPGNNPQGQMNWPNRGPYNNPQNPQQNNSSN